MYTSYLILSLLTFFFDGEAVMAVGWEARVEYTPYRAREEERSDGCVPADLSLVSCCCPVPCDVLCCATLCYALQSQLTPTLPPTRALHNCWPRDALDNLKVDAAKTLCVESLLQPKVRTTALGKFLHLLSLGRAKVPRAAKPGKMLAALATVHEPVDASAAILRTGVENIGS